MSTTQAAPRLDGQPRRVWTIGHSTRQVPEVVDMLRAEGVDVLVDIRSYPSSRAHPQWGQEALRAALPKDLDYVWLKDLGGRRHTPAGVASVNGGWTVKAFRDYADYTATEGFRQGMDDLVALTDEHRPVIMCSEAVPWRCPRRLVTDALLVRGVEVSHIMSPTSVRAAELTDFAVVDGTRITYPPPDSLPLDL